MSQNDNAESEHSTQTSLTSLGDMATRMGHASNTMEIIGIAKPEDAEALEKMTSQRNTVLTLPDKQD